MSISVEFQGDVDRLPHKDLAEHVVKVLNETIKEALEKAGIGDQFTTDNGTERRVNTKTRTLGGNEPYFESGEQTSANASWTVHLPDPS